MHRHRRTGYAAAGIAALVAPFAAPLSTPATAVAATALFAEGATRPSGEAQTAFAGAFCEQNTCRSLGRGTFTSTASGRRIQEAVESTPGEIIVAGYSVGAAGVYNRLRVWEEDPTLAPDPERIVLVVTYGNPENKFGGENRNFPGTGLPETQPYEHLDVVAQYDSVADSPTRFGFYSAVNSLFSSRHFSYFDGLDVNDPDNLVYQEGNTTYMLIPAETLPMVSWMSPFVSDERLAELDARYRPLVERDYDRPDYVPQGAGADWGNGTPPPSLQDPADEQPTETDTGTDADDETASVERVSLSGTDDTETDVDSDADIDVDVADQADSDESGDDPDVDERDLDVTVDDDEQAESDDTAESSDTDSASDTDKTDTDTDKTGTDETDSDKAGED